MYGCACATACLWGSDGNCWEMARSFHPLGVGDQTQAFRLGSKLYPLSRPRELNITCSSNALLLSYIL